MVVPRVLKRPRRTGRLVRFALVALIVAVTAASCQRRPTPTPPPPPSVTVARPIVREVTDWDEYPGRLAAPDAVDVRARVSGYLESAPFIEGSIVKAGDLLFVIDERPYRAEYERALAEVARAEAQLRFATGEFQRLDRLHQAGGASETEYFNARQSMESAQAAVQAAKAAAETARLNLEWCRVTAPIAGRVGRRLVTPGNLITGGGAQATLLTSITSLDPIYCYVEVDERSVRKYQRLIRERNRPSARETRLPAQLALVDEPNFPHQGYIDFVNNQIDPGTGTITVRAVFPNPDRQLLPGFFARLRVPGQGPYRAILVPEAAIGANLAQQYVLTVAPDDVVQLRPVKPGTSFGAYRAVEGINPDDRVVIDGLVQARPGNKVSPHEVALPPPVIDQPPTTLPAVIPGARPAATGPATTTPAATAPSSTAPTTRQLSGAGGGRP